MKQLNKLYEWVLFLPAVLPLFYVEGMMYPLMTPKTLALRAFGVIALALFSYLALSRHSFYWNRLRRWETWIPGVLLAVAYVNSLIGTDFYHSFWSTFERGDGLLTLTVCVLYFYLTLLSASASWFPRLLKLTAWVGSLAAVYLILQWLNVPFIVQSNGRIGGTLGNAAFLSAYLGMAFFATLMAAREYGTLARRTLYAGAVLELIAIALAATRGTILALFAIGIAALLYTVWKRRGNARVYAGASLLGLAVIVGLFFTFRTTLQQAPIEPIRRLASISLVDPTVSSRLFIWRAVFGEAATERPFLGYGAEHIDVPFDKVYDPTAISEEWFDRTHNAYLDYFVQFGVCGALLYLALIVAFVRIGWFIWKRVDRYAPYLLGMIAVYSMQNFFVFDTSVTLWLFLMMLATGSVYSVAADQKPAAVKRARPLLSAVIGCAILLLIVPVAIQPLRANLLAFEAYLYQIVDVPRANAATEEGMALNTYADLEFGYNAYFMYTTEQINRLTGDDLKLSYENAIKVLTANFKRYPYDARTTVYLAQVLASAPPDMQIDNGLLSEVLARAIKESPKRAQLWYILVNIAIGEANTHPARSVERIAGYAAAQDILQKYIALVPLLSEPHFILAQLNYASGDTATAAREATLGKDLYRTNVETARRAVAYYGAIEDLSNLEFFLTDIVKEVQWDYASTYDLAKVKYLLGDKAGAEVLVAGLRVVDPVIIDSDPSFKAAITEYEKSVR